MSDRFNFGFIFSILVIGFGFVSLADKHDVSQGLTIWWGICMIVVFMIVYLLSESYHRCAKVLGPDKKVRMSHIAFGAWIAIVPIVWAYAGYAYDILGVKFYIVFFAVAFFQLLHVYLCRWVDGVLDKYFG